MRTSSSSITSKSFAEERSATFPSAVTASMHVFSSCDFASARSPFAFSKMAKRLRFSVSDTIVKTSNSLLNLATSIFLDTSSISSPSTLHFSSSNCPSSSITRSAASVTEQSSSPSKARTRNLESSKHVASSILTLSSWFFSHIDASLTAASSSSVSPNLFLKCSSS